MFKCRRSSKCRSGCPPMMREEPKLRWTRKRSSHICPYNFDHHQWLRSIHNCLIIAHPQLCDNCECNWELPPSDAAGESESGIGHLPCTHSHHRHQVRFPLLMSFTMYIVHISPTKRPTPVKDEIFADPISSRCAGFTKQEDGIVMSVLLIESSPTQWRLTRLSTMISLI